MGLQFRNLPHFQMQISARYFPEGNTVESYCFCTKFRSARRTSVHFGLDPPKTDFWIWYKLVQRVLYDLPNENYNERTGDPLPPNSHMPSVLRSWQHNVNNVDIIQIVKLNQNEEHSGKHPCVSPIFQSNENMWCVTISQHRLDTTTGSICFRIISKLFSLEYIYWWHCSVPLSK